MAELNGPMKAAAFVVQLGPKKAAALLRHLSDEDAKAIAAAIARLPDLDRETVDGILHEVVDHVGATGGYVQGGVEAAKRYTGRTVDDSATSHHSLPGTIDAPADLIVEALRGESPAVAAVVLGHLEPARAAKVLDLLPAEVRNDTARRYAKIGPVDRMASEHVVSEIRQRLARIRPRAADASGIEQLVAVLSNAGEATAKAVLDRLYEIDPVLAEAVESRLFDFDDLLRLDRRDLARVLREVQVRDLAVAARGLAGEQLEALLGALSERTREDVVDEIEVIGPQPMAAVQAARNLLLASARELDRAGEIILRPEEMV